MPKPCRTVSHEWDAFRRSIPVGVHPRQYRDMRRTFYLGAKSGVLLLAEQDRNLANPTEPLVVERERVRALVQELADFASHVNAGRS